MSTLSFDIRPSEESNDHQVRILVDGQDVLGDQYLGLDPPEFFAQFNAPKEHLLIGRCTCGVVGCSDYSVSVRRSASIDWIVGDVVIARFDADEYGRTISAAANDHDWETQGRRIERLIGSQLAGTVTTDGYDFEWASTRLKRSALTLHFVKDKGLPTYAYRLVDISWDGRTDESALQATRNYAAEHCA
jgi:hypothetical protein